MAGARDRITVPVEMDKDKLRVNGSCPSACQELYRWQTGRQVHCRTERKSLILISQIIWEKGCRGASFLLKETRAMKDRLTPQPDGTSPFIPQCTPCAVILLRDSHHRWGKHILFEVRNKQTGLATAGHLLSRRASKKRCQCPRRSHTGDYGRTGGGPRRYRRTGAPRLYRIHGRRHGLALRRIHTRDFTQTTGKSPKFFTAPILPALCPAREGKTCKSLPAVGFP